MLNTLTEGNDSGAAFSARLLYHMLSFWRVRLKPREKGLGVEMRLRTNYIASLGPDEVRELIQVCAKQEAWDLRYQA